MKPLLSRLVLPATLLAAIALPASAQAPRPVGETFDCRAMDVARLTRNPTPWELRCHYGARGPGRFGLASYMDVPVYQPATPLPGTHVVGVAGLPAPRAGESYEAWEWRVLRTEYGADARRVRSGVEVLEPVFAGRILRLERALREHGVSFRRLETWRAPERQACLFQQGRSRPGPFATSTLTSWHSRGDGRGNPASRAVDYSVPGAHMRRFHLVVKEVGLESYGADSNDPGHVYLPGGEGMVGEELALLRLLPRVPVVTLATGRPADEWVGEGRLQQVRDLARSFLEGPFAAAPRLNLVLSRLSAPALRVAAAKPEEPQPAPTPARKGRGRSR